MLHIYSFSFVLNIRDVFKYRLPIRTLQWQLCKCGFIFSIIIFFVSFFLFVLCLPLLAIITSFQTQTGFWRVHQLFPFANFTFTLISSNADVFCYLKNVKCKHNNIKSIILLKHYRHTYSPTLQTRVHHKLILHHASKGRRIPE